jgi:hypothetical protein
MTELAPTTTARRMSRCPKGSPAARAGFRPRIEPMPNVTLPAQRRNCTSCPVRLALGPTAVSVDANAYDSEHEETDSFGFFREVTPDLPGMYAYDAHGHLSAATSGSTPGDGCTDGRGIVNPIYAGDNPIDSTDSSGLSSGNGLTRLAQMAATVPTQCGSARGAALNAYWTAYRQAAVSADIGGRVINGALTGLAGAVAVGGIYAVIGASPFLFAATPLGLTVALVGGFVLGAAAGAESNSDIEPPRQGG